MADTKVSAFTSAASILGTDVLPIVVDPGGTPAHKKVTVTILAGFTRASTAVAAMAIDWSLSGTFSKTLAAGANTFTFSNATDGQTIVVAVTGAASTLTWPTVKWSGGVAPTQTASGIDIYTFCKIGSTIYGSVLQAMA